MREIRVLGLAGSTSQPSSTMAALSVCLAAARRAGACTVLLTPADIDLPLYEPNPATPRDVNNRLFKEVSRADGLVLATPAYHGTMSSHLKNILDHIELLRDDPRPYFEDRAVGCIAVGDGWQGAVSALAALRVSVHALRGWPTPLGAALNSGSCRFDGGRCEEPRLQRQLETVGEQVVEFAVMRRAVSTSVEVLTA
jgi:FMN reductase